MTNGVSRRVGVLCGGAGGEGDPELNIADGGDGGNVYGVNTSPIFLGSGGGNGVPEGAVGGAGGGSIKIVSTGTVTINGEILADGEDSSVSLDTNTSGGAGSGGSVFIEAGTIAGSGSVYARGGNSASAVRKGGGGGGGRIAMYATNSRTFSGTVSANRGLGGVSNGQVGTVVGPTCYPNAPTDTLQYTYETVSKVTSYHELVTGGSTRSTQLKFTMLVSDVDTTDTLYAESTSRDTRSRT